MGNRFWRIASPAVAVAVAAGGAGTAYAAMSGSGPAYRLADATSAAVTAALHEVGTLTPANEADVAFAVSGTVASVDVHAGQHVAAGKELGALDLSSFTAGLDSAEEALASANLTVSTDLASEDHAAGGSSGGGGSSSSSSSSSSGTGPGSPSSSLHPLQQAVLAAQRHVDGALAQAKTALAQARLACATATGPAPTSTPTPARSPAPTPSGTSPATRPHASAPASAPASPGPGGGPSSGDKGSGPSAVTCAAATQAVLRDETLGLQAEQALSGRLTALAEGLAGPGAGAQGGAVSAARLAADQAAADAAAAQVTVAQENLADAAVVSPIGGTVLTVEAHQGALAGAGTTEFVIAGLRSYEAVTDVPVTDMPVLKVGQPASVTPDGSGSALSGTVVSIGLIPDSSGNYPVTIGLTGSSSGLHPGGLAAVTITTARGTGVSVPTSAIHGSGRKATVTLYSGGKTRVARVRVGTMGPVWTRITSGLTAGQQVVLANLSQPLPNNNPDNQGPGGPGGPGFVGPGFARVAPRFLPG